MTIDFNTSWRYAAYAITAALGLAAYVWLGTAASNVPPLGGRSLPHIDKLPVLTLLDAGSGREARRDLFVYVKAVQNVDQASALRSLPDAAPAPVPVELAAPKIDLLADLKVMGIVHQPEAITVLLRIGTTIRTVAVGERFGAGAALSVQSVEGRHVKIVDNTSLASRTFTLSEE